MRVYLLILIRWKETAMKAAALAITAFILLSSSTQGQDKEISPNGCDLRRAITTLEE